MDTRTLLAGLAPAMTAAQRHTVVATLTSRNLHAARRRHRRPGPKSIRDHLMALLPAPGERLSATWLYAGLPDLVLPARLPGDRVWAPPAAGAAGYQFRPLTWNTAGRPADRLTDIGPRILRSTKLFDRGAPIRIITTFFGIESDPVNPTGPPYLWATALVLGTRAGYLVQRWDYQSATAAHHGHAVIVHTIQATRQARRPAKRLGG